MPPSEAILRVAQKRAIAAAALVLCATPANATDGPSLWLTPSLERTDRNAEPKTLKALELFAARGECESFQINLRGAPDAANSASVTTGAFAGDSGAVLPANATAVYRQHYVRVEKPSPDFGGAVRPLTQDWFPDALIAIDNASKFQLDAGANQPLWIDVCVPREADSGLYRSEISATIDGASFSASVTLKVWDFTLPLQPSLNSAFLVWKPNPAISIELLKNKLMPRDVEPRRQAEYIETLGLKSTNVGLWSKSTGKQCEMAPAPSAAVVRKAAAINDPRLARYNYTADEIDDCPQQYDTMKAWARVLHAEGIDNLVTMTPAPELFDDGSGTGRSAVDIWVLLPKMYEKAPDRVAEALAKGDRVWSYAAIVQDDYSPKWLIDFEPINFRIQPGFINQSLGLTGLLYWQVDRWTTDPWKNVATYKNEDGEYPGEGMLVYPGRPMGFEGVAPSMRLKWIRDGVEDYEYIELLRKAGCGTMALTLARGVGASWREWTKDPKMLEFERHRVGDYVEYVTRTKGDCAMSAPAATE